MKDFVKYFLMVDNIFLVQVSVSYVFITLLFILNEGQASAFNLTYGVVFSISFHFQSANFRVMILYCKWNKIQLIMYKLVIAICCIFNLSYGCYFYIEDFAYTNG